MKHDAEYYLAKGFDPVMAEYFAAGRKTIVKVEPMADYQLLLEFDNGERRVYDCKPLMHEGSVFEALRQEDTFERVYLDDTHAVAWDIDPNVDSEMVWSNKLDICPDTCYVDGLEL